jgi:hypothetical protein
VARVNPRLTAGVGLVAAFLLLGAPTTAAIADPGGGHSDRGNGWDRGSGDGRDGSGHDDDGGYGGHRRGENDGNVSGKTGSNDSPQVRVGSGRGDVEELTPSNGSASSGAGRSGSTGRSGSDRTGAPNAGFNPPRVTVGNGRSPGILSDDPEPRWRAPAPQPAPAPPPPPPPPAPAPPSSWVEVISTPPVLTQQLGVSSAVDWTGPLWGIAGLLLIPAAGAALGYRQARAAHAAEKLRRT